MMLSNRVRRSVGWCVALAASLGVGISATEVVAQGMPARKRIYIGLDDHTDFVWNSTEAANRQSFLDMLDFYLDLKDQTAGSPPDYQSRFNCDASLMVRVYEEQRTPAQFARLIEGIRSGHITVPITTLVNTYGGTPAEGVLRGMYYAGTLERRFGLRLPLALSMENQTLPWGLSSLWAGSGAKYSWRGVCGCVTRTPFGGSREHEVFWYTGPDGQRVLLKWYSALTAQPDSTIGGYAEARFLTQAVDAVTVNAATNGFQSRYPFDVVGVFGFGWDNTGAITTEFVTSAPQLTNASRRVIVSNQIDFFQDFLATYPSQIPSVNYSYGNEWELYQSSMAELTARVRRSLDKARGAEAMATIASLGDPSFMTGREAERTAFNLGLGMYWEHDWTGDGGFAAEKTALQRRLVGDIERYVDRLDTDGRAWLSARIAPTPGTSSVAGSRQFYVFNALGFARSDAADIPWADIGPVSVYDVSGGTPGVEVPSQIVTVDGVRMLRIWAADVPSVGYAVYEARPVAGAAFAPAATVSGVPGGTSTATIGVSITADNRDALSLDSGGAVREVRLSGYLPGDRHNYWSSDSEQETAGVQFPIDLPPGTVVTDARLVLTASPASLPSAAGASRIRAYAVDDAPAFVAGAQGDLAAFRPLAAGAVDWAAPTWTPGVEQTSPDLSSLVQAFVDRPGFTRGNTLGLVIDPGSIAPGSYYGFDDFSKPGGTPARLTITYRTGGGAASRDLVLENGRYRVRVSPRGAITSLVDPTRAGREFAATIGGRAINDLGGGAAGDDAGTLQVESQGPVSVTLVASTPVPIARTARVTLYRGGDRIAMSNLITQNFSDVRDWSFAFSLASPRVRHEEVGAIATAALRTAGGSYATQNARYDWLTLNHFADMDDTSGVGVGVTLANTDVPFFRLGNSGVDTLDTATPQMFPVAGGRLDGPGLGLPDQGGDSRFAQRFALRTRAASTPGASMRFALEHASPLVTGMLAPDAGVGQTLPPGRFSLLSVSNPDVILWTLKPAEDGPGALGGPVTARFWNVSDQPGTATATVRFAGKALRAASSATHLETLDAAITPAPTVQASALDAAFAPQQIRTFRLDVSCAADFDGSGARDVSDIFAFLSAWFASAPGSDFNNSGTRDVSDIFAFLSAWFAGCP